MKTLLLLFLGSSLLLAQQETVISGKLLGYDKKPMVMAHVHLLKAPNPNPLAQVQAGSDGSFEVRTKETGLLVLEFTGVSHTAFDLPLVVEKPLRIGLSATLATYSYADEIKDVKIMSDLTNFAFNKAQPMQLQSDGTLAIELEANVEKLAYQILGAEKTGRSINGTQSDAYEYDGGGDYKSIVTPKGGKVRIVFDPKKTVRSTNEAEVKFADPSTTVARVATIQMETMKRSTKWLEAANAYVAAGKDFKTFTYDWSAVQASIVGRLKSEKDPLVRQALLLSYVDTKSKGAVKADSMIGAQTLKEIPPDSKLWMMPTLSLIKSAADLSGLDGAYEKYLEQFLEKNPDMTLKTTLLANQLMSAKAQNDEKQLKLHYDLAMRYFGETPFGAAVRQRFSPTIAIAVGKTVPAFKVKKFEDTTKFYTNATFKGKVLLVDIWASWCGPCVGEMENLHRVYEKFKSKNFQILSLSLDKLRTDVTEFRTDKWKMPWLHSFVTHEREFQEAFEIVTIPKPILVDGSGKIVAMEEELRGPNLEKTLTKFLGEAK